MSNSWSRQGCRWRDFADIYLLSRHHPVGGFGLAESRWVAWRANQDLTDRLPEAFTDVVSAVIAFGDPVAIGAVAGASWKPERTTWEFEST